MNSNIFLLLSNNNIIFCEVTASLCKGNQALLKSVNYILWVTLNVLKINSWLFLYLVLSVIPAPCQDAWPLTVLNCMMCYHININAKVRESVWCANIRKRRQTEPFIIAGKQLIITNNKSLQQLRPRWPVDLVLIKNNK